jgi:hypothetical protein
VISKVRHFFFFLLCVGKCKCPKRKGGVGNVKCLLRNLVMLLKNNESSHVATKKKEVSHVRNFGRGSVHT